MSVQSDRVERALKYLDDVVTGVESPDSVRVAAARAVVARDAREAAGDTQGITRGYRVLLPEDTDDDV